MNKKVLFGALSTIVIAGTGTAASAFADTTSTMATTTQQATNHQWQGHNDGGQLNEIAKLLNIDVQNLQSDLQSGKSIVDVAQAQGVSEQTLISDLQSQLKTRLDQAVSSDKLTADKEQQSLSNAAARFQKLVEHKGPFTQEKHQERNGGGRLNEIAKLLNIDAQTLQSDLQSGKSIVDVAIDQGVTEDTLITDLQQQLQSNLDKAVQSGKLTSDKEQQALANFPTNIKKFLEQKGPFKQGNHQDGKGAGRLNQVAKILGIDVQTLQSDLQQGQSIADVAQAKGISEQTLISDLQSQMKTNLDQAVQNGKLTQDKETQILSNSASKAQQFVEHKGVFTHQKQESQKQPSTTKSNDEQ